MSTNSVRSRASVERVSSDVGAFVPGKVSTKRSRRLPASQIDDIEKLVAKENEGLLTHRYFQLCRTRSVNRSQAIDIVKQLYCFSVFFERIIAQRIARYSSGMDGRVLRLARQHMREEFGHPDMFRECLMKNGVTATELTRISPKMFTKAMFGYLMATVLYENEFVSNIAIMQVMEKIALHFFQETLLVMESHDLTTTAFRQHSEDDELHSTLGLDLAASFDIQTMASSRRIIEDLYRLMGFVLDEWLSIG